jgi:hypothetical protein
MKSQTALGERVHVYARGEDANGHPTSCFILNSSGCDALATGHLVADTTGAALDRRLAALVVKR